VLRTAVRSRGLGRKPIFLIVAAVLVVGALVGVGIARAAAAPTELTPDSPLGIYTSASADRGNATPLHRQVVRGKIHISVVAGPVQVESVTFWLDNPVGDPVRVERVFPYDFSGGAPDGSSNALDTATLKNGDHVVFAEITLKDGKRLGEFATFKVDNGTGQLEPAPKPSPTTPKPTPSATTAPPKPSTGGGKCPLPAYPSPDCTGLPAGTDLTTINGDYVASKPGQVIEGKRITGRLAVKAKGVIIRKSELLGGVNNFTGSGSYPYTIEDSTVGPASGCYGDFAIGAENFTARRVLIRNSSDGFRVSGDNILIEDSFAKVCTDASNHSDGIQGHNGGNNVVIRHNTIDQRGVTNATSPIFMADGTVGADVTGNLLMGGGYVVRLHSGSYSFENNAVVQGAWGYGPVYSDCGGIDWSNNKLVQINGDYEVTKTLSALNCTGR
jgi:hypothetical protein